MIPVSSQPSLVRRFFKVVTIAPVAHGFALQLDGRDARTPARYPLVLPTRALGMLVAAEWEAVGATIDPRAMPTTRLANSVIDGVQAALDGVQAEILRYAASDMLLYRAGEPARLAEAQTLAWDPIVTWSREALGSPLILAEGVVFVRQPEASLASLRRAVVEAVGDDAGSAFRLGALHVMTTLTGSALLALAVVKGRIDVESAWTAAHIDEDFQIAEWGEDAEASERRRSRWVDMKTASLVHAASQSSPE